MTDTNAFISIENRPDGSTGARFGELELMSAFQPIWAFPVAPGSEPVSVVAYEGLLRVRGVSGEVPPDLFLSRLDVESRARVEATARQLHLVNAASCLPPTALVFVNFDPTVVTDRGSAERMLQDMRLAMREAGLAHERVVCEITEMPAGDERALVIVTDGLRAAGHRIAVDDFGAEAADAGRVDRIGPEFIKFDASWVARHMATAAGFEALVGLVERFSARGIVTVFEGIEEGWQIELAERSGVSMVQGYGLARPALAAGRA